MKKLQTITAVSCFLFILALVSLILLTLPQDTDTPPDDGKTPPSTDTTDAAGYLGVIQTLEKEITQLKEQQYQNSATYEEQIELLKSEVKQLNDALQAAQTEPSLPYTYTIENGRAIITAYIGDEDEVILPAAIENCPVTEIGQKAFYQKKVSRVVLPATVTKIGWFAFWGCSSLAEIRIPDSVEAIGYAVFDECAKNFTVLCSRGSYAEKYAKSYGMNYRVS